MSGGSKQLYFFSKIPGGRKKVPKYSGVIVRGVWASSVEVLSIEEGFASSRRAHDRASLVWSFGQKVAVFEQVLRLEQCREMVT